MMRNKNIWLVVAILLGIVGFFSTFFTMLSAMCTGDCSIVFARTAATVGLFSLGAAFFSAIYSVCLSGSEEKRSSGNTLVKILGVLTALITGFLFFMIIVFLG